MPHRAGISERLTGDLARAGFSAPATHALTQAGAAQAATRVTEVQAQCTAARKALVALTALDEDTLQQQLDAPRRGRAPWLQLDSVPARVLEQRRMSMPPRQAVAAASDDVGQAEAQRYPHLGLSGDVIALTDHLGGIDADATTWIIGPLSLVHCSTVAGVAPSRDAARVAYQAAASQYRATVRNAVREVETALVKIDSARQAQCRRRGPRLEGSARPSAPPMRATAPAWAACWNSRMRAATCSRPRQARITLRKQTDSAWVALSRALGGGWPAPAPVASAGRKGSTPYNTSKRLSGS